MRLFVAVGIPDAHRRQIHDLSLRLKKALPKIRASWVPLENYHVTVLFLGSTGLGEQVFRKLERLTTPSFQLGLGSLGAFPDQKRASVLWMGAGTGGLPGESGLSRLAIEVEERLRPLGFLRGNQAFHGHLTLARVKVPTDLGSALEAEKGTLLEPFAVKELLVFQSETTPSGARYHELLRFPLA